MKNTHRALLDTLLRCTFWLLLFLLAATPAFAQSCALCYTQAASAGARMIEALRSGILILALPPTFASVAMLFIVHRKRNQTRHLDGKDWGES